MQYGVPTRRLLCKTGANRYISTRYISTVDYSVGHQYTVSEFYRNIHNLRRGFHLDTYLLLYICCPSQHLCSLTLCLLSAASLWIRVSSDSSLLLELLCRCWSRFLFHFSQKRQVRSVLWGKGWYSCTNRTSHLFWTAGGLGIQYVSGLGNWWFQGLCSNHTFSICATVILFWRASQVLQGFCFFFFSFSKQVSPGASGYSVFRCVYIFYPISNILLNEVQDSEKLKTFVNSRSPFFCKGKLIPCSPKFLQNDQTKLGLVISGWL